MVCKLTAIFLFIRERWEKDENGNAYKVEEQDYHLGPVFVDMNEVVSVTASADAKTYYTEDPEYQHSRVYLKSGIYFVIDKSPEDMNKLWMTAKERQKQEEFKTKQN